VAVEAIVGGLARRHGSVLPADELPEWPQMSFGPGLNSSLLWCRACKPSRSMDNKGFVNARGCHQLGTSKTKERILHRRAKEVGKGERRVRGPNAHTSRWKDSLDG
jgi:hypothetical protein